MAAGGQVPAWEGPSRRRVLRYPVQAPLDVTVLRSGIPDSVPGMSVNLCEGGVAAVLAGELTPGESVGVELRLPQAPEPLRMRALVRYQDKLRCGLEFVGLSLEQQTAIRDLAERLQTKSDSAKKKSATPNGEPKQPVAESTSGGSAGPPPTSDQGSRRLLWLLVLATLTAILLAIFWWRWNRGWAELESGLPGRNTAADGPRVQVAPEVMEKLILHRVAPAYPESARQAKVQGVIALDVVIGKNGSVASVTPLNGPDVLARAAADAVRWWKYEPYRVNGVPVVAETTVAVEFKP
jgi:TonB family protein